MTYATARPQRRELLVWARRVVAHPGWHHGSEVAVACDVMIHFGNLDDLSKATQLRAAIATGAVKPGATAIRLRRWTNVAALITILVWTLAWIIGAVADAQAAGRLPSIVEMFR